MLLLQTKFLIPRGFRGLTIYPFVFFKEQADRSNILFINHEKIHLRQQIEMLLLPFFIWYLIEFVIRLVQYKNVDLAYLNISFEREAYAHEKDRNYLDQRFFFSFLKYLSTND